MLKRSFVKGRKSAGTLLTLAALGSAMILAIASPALAGGFQLSIETPSKSTEPQLKDVVLVARTYGCHQPADARIMAVAEGFVNGQRKSVQLDLNSIASGVYAIKRQWPAEGKWVIAITGAYNGMTSSVLVELGRNGEVIPGTRLDEGSLKGVHAKGARRSWATAEIDSALKGEAGAAGDEQGDGSTALSSLERLSLLVGGLGASAFTIGFVTRSRRRRADRDIAS